MEEEITFCKHCGEETKNLKYCDKKCQNAYYGQQQKDNYIINANKFPTWICDKCNCVIQLGFNPTKNSFTNMRFEQLKKEHVCKQ